MKKRFAPQVLLLGTFLLGAPLAFATLTFDPFFDATIGGNASMVATIDDTLALYSDLFSTNIEVSIYFQNMSSGLGGSETTFYSSAFGGAGGVCNALAAGATSADDATSVMATGSCAGNNPVDNAANINYSSANGRALGFATPGSLSAGGNSGLDGIISLNTSIMNITRPDSNPSHYDMQSVIEHEVDEVLGTVSGADGLFSNGLPTVADLFRYSAPGARTFTVPGTAYLSVNGGVTNLAGYHNVANCNVSAGDCGDFDLSALRVQNWAGTPGATPDVTLGSPEERLLDAVGYTLAVPEPSTLWLAALGFGLWAGAKKLRLISAVVSSSRCRPLLARR